MKPLKGDLPAAEAWDSLLDTQTGRWVYISAAVNLQGNLSNEGGAGDDWWYERYSDAADVRLIGAETFRGGGSRYASGSIAVLSQSLQIDPASLGEEVVVFTSSEENPPWANDFEIVRTSRPWEILDYFGDQRIMIDGGGMIYSLFLPWVQDLFLTHIPRFAGGTPLWRFPGSSPKLELSWLFEGDDELYARWHNKDPQS